jgi:hypothetical protein
MVANKFDKPISRICERRKRDAELKITAAAYREGTGMGSPEMSCGVKIRD